MTRYGMALDLKRCVGCGACVVACQLENNVKEGVAWIQLDTVEWGEEIGDSGRVIVPHACMQCPDAPCAEVCPTGATMVMGDGVVNMDYDACINCGSCIQACPYGARVVNKTRTNYFGEGIQAPYEAYGDQRVNVVEKCNFCYDRVQSGLTTACVWNCPGKARYFGDLDDPESEISQRIAKDDMVQIDGTSFWYAPVNGMPDVALPTAANLAQGESVAQNDSEEGVNPVAVTMTVSGNGVDFAFAEGEVDTSKPIEKRHTFCDMCNQVPFCGLTAYVQDNHVVRIESRQPFATGPLCAKGMASIQELYDPERLLHPQRRTNAKGDPAEWEQITWDEAYAEIASQLNKVKDEYGAEKVMFYCGDPKEPRGPICRVASLFGSPHLGFESSLCATATQMAMRLVYGSNQARFGVDPSDDTNCCIIWSLNAAWSQPNRHLSFMKQKERGCKFIIVDPRITPTVTSLADIHLQPRPGTDGALALGFINQLIEQDLYDHDFVENWTHGFDELKELAAEYTPEKVEEITWVPKEKLLAAVAMAADNTPTTLQSSSAGITHTTNAGHAQRAVFMIPALLGMVDVKGGMWFGMPALPVAGGATGRGTTTQFRMDKTLNSEDFKNRRADKDDFPAWWTMNPHFQTAKLPEYVKDGKIKAAVLVGTNAMIWPHTSEYQEAIKNMDFTVAVDYYYRPWTHDYVDMILPAATCYERMAPFATFGRTIYFRDPVITPLGEAREDWQIMLELGCVLGFEEECFGGSVEKAIEYVLETGNVGVTVADLRAGKEEGVTIPGEKNSEKKYENAKFAGNGKDGFATPSGKVEFVSELLKNCGLEGRPVYEEPIHSPVDPQGEDKNYTLVLNSGGRLPYYTHSKLREIPWLNQFMPEPVVRLHPKDAEKRNIKTGDDVKLYNHLGEIQVKAEVSNIVLPGVVDIFYGWHQANINELIPRDFDPVTGYPPFRAALCEVELV